jgi:hypothetical protein
MSDDDLNDIEVAVAERYFSLVLEAKEEEEFLKIMRAMEERFARFENDEEVKRHVVPTETKREVLTDKLLSIEECQKRYRRILERRRESCHLKENNQRRVSKKKKERPRVPIYPNHRQHNVARRRRHGSQLSIQENTRIKTLDSRRKVKKNRNSVCVVDEENVAVLKTQPLVVVNDDQPLLTQQAAVVTKNISTYQSVSTAVDNKSTQLIIRIPDPVGSTKHLDLSGGIL